MGRGDDPRRLPQSTRSAEHTEVGERAMSHEIVGKRASLLQRASLQGTGQTRELFLAQSTAVKLGKLDRLVSKHACLRSGKRGPFDASRSLRLGPGMLSEVQCCTPEPPVTS